MDIGTNSFHLVVARMSERGRFEVLATEKEMVRLGSGSGDMNALSPEAMERGIETLKRFRMIADSFAAPLTAVATSALREAGNRAAFVDLARSEAGVEIDVVSGAEEARLIHLGVLQALPVFDERVLVVDIGGGSTEFVVGRGRNVRSALSTKLGAIRLTDRFFPGGVIPKRKAVRQCRTHIRSFLVPTVRRVRDHGPFRVVGSSGTINTLARMILAERGTENVSHLNGVQFTREELGSVIDALIGAPTPEERGRLPGLDEKRQDIIVAGALLLEQIMDSIGIRQMTVSEAALREGVLLDSLAREGVPSFHHLNDIRRESVVRMAALYHEDLGHIQRATDLSLRIFDGLGALHELDIGARDLLEAAAMLHNVGLFISHAAHHKHSYYVIRNGDQLAGFTDREIELIAQIARYHRKSAPKPTHSDFCALDQRAQDMVRMLAGILRIGIALDRTRQGGVEELHVAITDSMVTIQVGLTRGVDYSLEQYTTAQRLDLLEATLDRSVEVVFATVEPAP